MLYTTIEIFHGAKPGIRINGDISTELMIQLSSSTTAKTIQDDRGWSVIEILIEHCFVFIVLGLLNYLQLMLLC